MIPLQKIIDNIRDFYNYRNVNGFNNPHIEITLFDTKNTSSLRNEIEPLFKDLSDSISYKTLINWMEPEETFTSNMPGNLNHNTKSKKTCANPFYQLVIHSDLNVSICCNDWKKSLVVGNLRRKTLLEIWFSIKWNDIRIKILKDGYKTLDECKFCETPLFGNEMDNLDEVNFEDFIKKLDSKKCEYGYESR